MNTISVEYDPLDNDEEIFTAAIHKTIETLLSLSWDAIADNTNKDPTLHNILVTAENEFLDSLSNSNPKISQFWRYQESLYALYRESLYALYSSQCFCHVGSCQIFISWPGITFDIHAARLNCRSCNSTAPHRHPLQVYLKMYHPPYLSLYSLTSLSLLVTIISWQETVSPAWWRSTKLPVALHKL